MSLAFALLLVAVAASPVSAILDGFLLQSIVAITAVAALAAVGTAARAADVVFAARVTRHLNLVVALPALWMAIQLLPTPLGAHSIWTNANETLNQQSWGHISIDLGATINALALYLSNVALIVVSLFVGRDRRRADFILFALAAIAVLTTIVLLVSKLTQNAGREVANDPLGAVSALGLILSLALAARDVERNESARAPQPLLGLKSPLLIPAVGLVACIAGLAAGATLNVALTALIGVAVLASIQAIRRLDLPNWAAGIVFTTIIIAVGMIIAWGYDASRPGSPLLQFATQAPGDALSMAQRILSDTTWRGAGAGTYAQLTPIYRELGNSVRNPPTTAAAIAIELGWPMALFAIAAAFGLGAALYRGALVRGRDSFYPAAAAAFVVALVGEAFCDLSLCATCVSVIGTTMIGLGLAQSMSSSDNA